MAFTIKSNDVAQDPAIQSTWYDVDIDIFIAGFEGRGVVSGCAVTAQGSPDMTVAVAAGVVRNADGTTAAVSGGNLTVGAADGSNPRVDLISASSAGVKTITAGTAAAAPKPPALPAGHIGLAMILVGTGDTAIQNAEITDKRVVVQNPTLPIVAACASDHDNSTTAGTEVTDLSKTLGVGTYQGHFFLMLQTATNTVGPRVGLNFTGTVTNKVINLRFPGTGTTAATGDIDDTAGAPAGNLHEGQPINAFSTTSPNMGPAGITTPNVPVLAVVEFEIVVTVAGDLELWHGSESATQTKVLAGSSLVAFKTA